jgi:hypothetical protein
MPNPFGCSFELADDLRRAVKVGGAHRAQGDLREDSIGVPHGAKR